MLWKTLLVYVLYIVANKLHKLNSLEDWAPVDEMYEYPNCKWIAETRLHRGVPGEQPQIWLLPDMSL